MLVLNGGIIRRGHNQRVQKGSTVLHAEMDRLENAERLSPAEYRRAVLHSARSLCSMCSGAILLYKIPTVIVGENQTFQRPEGMLRWSGGDVQVVDDEECVRLMTEFIAARPELWNEGIGELA